MIGRILMVVGAFLAAGYFGTMQVAKKINVTDSSGRKVSQSRAWLAEAVSGRKQYKVQVFGNGSVVKPGRRVVLFTDKPPAGQSETIFKFRAFDNEPDWLVPHRKAIIGLREGSQLSLGADSPNLTVSSVCEEVWFGLKCKTPTKESAAFPELLACENPIKPECNKAIDATIKLAGSESPLEFVEVCLLEKDEVCSGLFTAMLAKWEGNIDGKNSTVLKDSVMAIASSATKKSYDSMMERLLKSPPAIAQIVLKELFAELNAEKMRMLLKAVQHKVAASSLITALVVTKIHDGSGQKLIAESGMQPPIAIQQTAELRNSLANRRFQIEASIRTGKMSEFEKSVFKTNNPMVPSSIKPLDLVKLSVDGYSPYMLAIIAGRNFSAHENPAVNPNDPNLLKANTRGETVLHFLAERGDVTAFQTFLERNPRANLEAKDAYGKRPIDWARERNFDQLVNYLENLKK